MFRCCEFDGLCLLCLAAGNLPGAGLKNPAHLLKASPYSLCAWPTLVVAYIGHAQGNCYHPEWDYGLSRGFFFFVLLGGRKRQ